MKLKHYGLWLLLISIMVISDMIISELIDVNLAFVFIGALLYLYLSEIYDEKSSGGKNNC